MKRRKQIFTDVDGVLLNMNRAFWEALSAVTGADQYGAVQYWDYRQVAGITPETHDKLWEQIWNIPLEPYEYVPTLVRECTRNHIWICACSARPTGPAKDAALRDFPQLNIPYTTFESHEAKADFIKRMWETSDKDTDTLYIEDKWDAAEEAARLGVETFLVNRAYNLSKDIETRYKRVYPELLPMSVLKWARGEDE